MEPKWLQKSIKKAEVFLTDFGPIFGGFWEHCGDQNTIKNRPKKMCFFGDQKMSPGAACGDPREAPEYLKASRHARRVSPEGPGNLALRNLLAP